MSYWQLLVKNHNILPLEIAIQVSNIKNLVKMHNFYTAKPVKVSGDLASEIRTVCGMQSSPAPITVLE